MRCARADLSTIGTLRSRRPAAEQRAIAAHPFTARIRTRRIGASDRALVSGPSNDNQLLDSVFGDTKLFEY